MKYNEILKALVGIPTLSAKIDKPFPLVGEDVVMSCSSTWVKQHNYVINAGDREVQSVLGCALGRSSKTVNMVTAGEFAQYISVSNDSGSASVRKVIYPMSNAAEPYFKVEASETIRVGETGYLSIKADNGYATSRNNTIIARLYRENEPEPVKTVGFNTDRPGPTFWASSPYSFDSASDRGIYDVEVDVTDVLTGVTFTQRHNKLITVTPALAPRDEAIEYLMPDAKIDGGKQSWIWDGSGVPAGSTIVLKYDPKYGEKYPMRFRMENFVGTWEKPIIITIDTAEPFVWNWYYWYGWAMANCHHIVIDGRGYKNLTKGLKLIAMPGFANTCLSFTSFDDEIEIFDVEIDGAEFAGMMIKTDPSPDNPDTWYDNFKFNRLLIHHCYIHDTTGEGSYIGYYGAGWIEGHNKAGETVRYRAHHLYNCRIYRNVYENQGYDNFQLNNAEDAEICYNHFINGGRRMEVDQTGALAISMSGKIYNNVIWGCQGPGIQVGWMGPLEFFNNLIAQGGPVSSAIYNLAWAEPPAEDGSFTHNEDPFVIHNNLLMSYSGILLGKTTNYTDNIQIYDNICIYKSILYGGQYAESIAKWTVKNNFEKKISGYPYDFEQLDIELKFGDSEGLDYRIASTSPLVEGGCGEGFRFDFNGYKNWYNKVFPIGPFLGKYRHPDMIDATFALASIVINGGAGSTLGNKVSVKMNCKGEVTHYRLGESSDISSTGWTEWSGDTLEYTFSTTGLKTLYCQIKSAAEESEVRSASIVYQESPLALSAIVMDGGVSEKNGRTVEVEIQYSGSVAPRYYRAGEVADLSAAGWTAFANIFTYTFDSIGAKTLYVQLRDEFGQMTEIRSAGITILQPRRTVISVGWPYDDVAPGCVFDEGLGINKVHFSTEARTFVWDSGEDAGTVTKTDSLSAFEDFKVGGATTGDDSGIYPDIVMEKYVRYNGFPQNTYGHRTASIHLPPGTYRLRLFCSLNSNYKNSTEFMKVQTVVDGVANMFELPEGYDVIGNLTQWLEQEITVPESGVFELQWGMENATKGWMEVPLNMIEIEEA